MIRETLDRCLADSRAAELLLRTEQIELMAADDSLEYAQEAQELLQTVAVTIQQGAHAKIASVVSRCLESVFDDPYDFQILFEKKRGKTEARLVFVREDVTIDPLSSSGGGVVDVAAFALKLACLMLTRPPLRRVMILDEAFRFVSEEYQIRVQVLLKQLAEEMGVQFIQVTHIDSLKCGKVVELS